MTTALDIVTRAFRKIDVGAEGEVLDADAASDGLVALNSMMHGWKLRSVDTEHTDLAAGDTFPLGPEFEEGTVYLLAGRLAPDYSAPQAFDADDWFRTFQAAYRVSTKVTVPKGLLYSPTGRRRWGYE